MARHPVIVEAVKLLRTERKRIDEALASLDGTGRQAGKRRRRRQKKAAK